MGMNLSIWQNNGIVLKAMDFCQFYEVQFDFLFMSFNICINLPNVNVNNYNFKYLDDFLVFQLTNAVYFF